MIVSITKCISDNQIMKDVMGEACSTCGGEESLHTEFWWGNLKGKGHMEDQDVNESLMLNWILK